MVDAALTPGGNIPKQEVSPSTNLVGQLRTSRGETKLEPEKHQNREEHEIHIEARIQCRSTVRLSFQIGKGSTHSCRVSASYYWGAKTIT